MIYLNFLDYVYCDIKYYAFASQLVKQVETLYASSAKLPTKTSGLMTLLRSPHVYKKSREHLFIRTTGRVFRLKNDRDGRLILPLLQCLLLQRYLFRMGCNIQWKVFVVQKVTFRTNY